MEFSRILLLGVYSKKMATNIAFDVLPPSFGLAHLTTQTVMGCETLISLTRPAENFDASKRLNVKLFL